MSVVTLFGGSHVREGEPAYEEARLLGRKLAEAGHTVCNGGYGGVMEASARGAKEAGGPTVGVTAEDFGGPANRWIDREIRVKKWSERLFKLIETGDAYVVLDGGTGTLVELFVVWEMLNKKFMNKPLIIMGLALQNLVDIVKKWPYVISHPKLIFATTTDEVLKRLQSNVLTL